MPPEIETRHLTIPRQARYALLGPEEGPREVWFGLHGYGQKAAGFLRYLTPLDDGTRLLVAPEGLHRYYLDHDEQKVGASWMTSEDRLTDIEDYVGWLDRLYGHLLGRRVPREDEGAVTGPAPETAGEPRTAPDPERVVALGFSQGVHTLCRWLAFGEARVDVAVLWGSHVPPDLDLEATADALRQARLLLVTGEDDPYYGPDAQEAVRERLAEHGIPAETVVFEGGHRLDKEVLLGVASD